jgi:hypothetical protein
MQWWPVIRFEIFTVVKIHFVVFWLCDCVIFIGVYHNFWVNMLHLLHTQPSKVCSHEILVPIYQTTATSNKAAMLIHTLR